MSHPPTPDTPGAAQCPMPPHTPGAALYSQGHAEESTQEQFHSECSPASHHFSQKLLTFPLLSGITSSCLSLHKSRCELLGLLFPTFASTQL